MRRSDLDTAIFEAERFLDRARACPRRADNLDIIDGGKKSAAVLRSSMELTRALADLRHPWRNRNE